MTPELIEALGTWIVTPLVFVGIVYFVTRQR